MVSDVSEPEWYWRSSLTPISIVRDFGENAIFADEFEDTLFLSNKPSWSPIAAYVNKREDQPHVMFTTRHDIDPRGEDLLRGEALAIAAAMITRLRRFSSEGHIYVPVSLMDPNSWSIPCWPCLILGSRHFVSGKSKRKNPSSLLWWETYHHMENEDLQFYARGRCPEMHRCFHAADV